MMYPKKLKIPTPYTGEIVENVYKPIRKQQIDPVTVQNAPCLARPSSYRFRDNSKFILTNQKTANPKFQNL